MPNLDAYVFFDGNCAEAMRFYERVLRGRIERIMTAGESPEGAKPDSDPNRILHARLVFENGSLLASDWMAPQPYPGRHGFSLSLGTPNVEEGQRLFQDLSEGGQVTMPFGKTFWAEGFGMLVDRYGTAWMVNVESPTP